MIELNIHSQPDDESCGPTSLHAIYQYYGLNLSLGEIAKAVDRSLSGGTLAPSLGKHALQNGFNATIYAYNLLIFDPTWFEGEKGESCPRELLIDKLTVQYEYKSDPYLAKVTISLIEFLTLGGEIRFRTLDPDLLKKYFKRNIPIITGLSATYLYRSARERFTLKGESIFDDVRGSPCGHFVVLCGYDDDKKHVVVADPHKENTLSHDNYYSVDCRRLINSIMLGVLTYDANLLIITPKGT